MGYTNPNYPVMEVAISCEHGGTHSGGMKERKTVGDIIVIRRPGLGVGLKEMSRYLWLRLEGLEENEMYRLVDEIEGFDKRRYCIPLATLKSIVPSFDIPRARNLTDKYQPFLCVDHDPPYKFLSSVLPFMVQGLVWDKKTGRFI